VTADELLRIPDDGFRYELVEGDLRKMTPAGGDHGRIALRIGASLLHHVEANDLGAAYGAETGFRLASKPDTVRAPDAAFVHKERAGELGQSPGYVPGAPDLVVEVVSPGDTYGEVEDKVLDWVDAGTRMVVVIHPKRRSATVYRSRDEIRVLGEEDEIDGADVVPGWRVRVGSLFV
jgi:Uma2 family endonuclease